MHQKYPRQGLVRVRMVPKSFRISALVLKQVARVRPNAAASAAGIPLGVLLGWYRRKSLVPVVRWAIRALSIGTSTGINFVGKSVTIMYGGKLYLGGGVSIGNYGYLNCFSLQGVHLGKGVTIREFCWLQCSSHPSNPGLSLVVGASTYIGPRALIGVGGAVSIGSRCQIGGDFTVVAENHAQDVDGSTSSSVVTRVGVVIGDDCWFGHGVTVLDGVVLGDRVVVGAGAVVTRSFPSGSRIAGVPARLLKGDVP